ncbi:MAG TPA: hypothetical protein VI233_10815, partial [Puia sp.]
SNSYHGHPNPLTCPPDRTRKSMALYYYTNGRPENEIVKGIEDHNTIFRHRPEDKKSRMLSTLKNVVKQVTPPILYGGLKNSNH